MPDRRRKRDLPADAPSHTDPERNAYASSAEYTEACRSSSSSSASSRSAASGCTTTSSSPRAGQQRLPGRALDASGAHRLACPTGHAREQRGRFV